MAHKGALSALQALVGLEKGQQAQSWLTVEDADEEEQEGSSSGGESDDEEDAE